MTDFAIVANETVVRIRADGNYVVAPEFQDGLDRMLAPLGSLHVIRCTCGGAAHAFGMPDEFLYTDISSMWHCHACGSTFRTMIGAWGAKLPQASYDVPGVCSIAN